LVLGYLVDKELVISGKLIVKKDFDHSSPFIADLLPWQRVAGIKQDDQGNYSQEILAQPVYFDLNLPQRFTKGTAEITYKNDLTACPTLLQIGGQASVNDWEYAMKPLENQALDRLNWPKVTENGVVLYEREKKFNTIDEFLNNLPNTKRIAVYNYKLDYDFKIPGYKPTKGLEINQTIRGRHVIYTYIDGEPLDFIFIVEDINRHVGADLVDIIVYKKDQQIYSASLPDDGIGDESGKSSGERKIKIAPPDLASGVYKIEIRASDDIFIRNIKTKEHLLAFANRLYLADSDEYKDSLNGIKTKPMTIYANGYKIMSSAAHQTSEQSILINNLVEPNNYEIELAEAHKQYSYFNLNPGNIVSLYSPKNDILIEGDGLFSFAKESFFNPLLDSFHGTELEAMGIDYVIANYQSPKIADGWKVAKADFDLSQLYWRNNVLRFALSIPDIECQDIKIKEIKFYLEKEPLTWSSFWQKALNKLKIK
jgi:hypothetical protein